MLKTYTQPSTGAFFSIRDTRELEHDPGTGIAHPWFTILILHEPPWNLVLDESRVTKPASGALFITPGQYLAFPGNSVPEGVLISFNKEFYCIEYHDLEVSCNGLLFSNNFNLVCVELDQDQEKIFLNTAREMEAEFNLEDPLMAEMLKNLLKNLLIRSNRLYREQRGNPSVTDKDFEFARKFSDLVEKHYKTRKDVNFYAGRLGLAPGSLAKKLQKLSIDTPSRIIRDRVVTEAKRLLKYSGLSLKEISYTLGYDDPHYFSRVFTLETNLPPSEYRRLHQA